MPAISDTEGLAVVGSTGRRLGSVRHVVFHPREPRVVGLMVAVPPFLLFFERKPRLVRLRAPMLKSCGEGGPVTWGKPRLPRGDEPLRDQGFTWDDTVVWRGMDATVADDGKVGRVADVVYSRTTLKVLSVQLSEGSLSDIAVGRTEVPGELVEGFDGKGVVVSPAFVEIPPSGGFAAASGKGVAHAKAGAERAADAMVSAGIAGLEVVERSFTSGLGLKAMRAMRKAGKRAAEAIRPDDE